MANRTQQNPKHDPKRFSDPLGEHIKSASEAQSRRQSNYPTVSTVFKAFYLEFEPTEKVGERFLGSSDGIIGSELSVRFVSANSKTDEAHNDISQTSTAKSTEHELGFYDYSGRLVATFDSPELRYALENNWKISCVLAYSIFTAQQKSLKGGTACFCYDSGLNEKTIAALDVFIESIIGRICAGTYLKLKLGQEQFIKIVSSAGKWFLINEQPWPKLPKGNVYFRRRRTLTERLIDVANRGNKGCLVASWIGMFVIIAAIVLAVWLIFFR